MWHEKHPKVMISNAILEKGDKVGDYTITEIGKASVVLNDGTEKVFLKIAE